MRRAFVVTLNPFAISLAQNWTQHMAARGVSDEEQQKATKLAIRKVRFSGHINSSLKQSGVDRLRAVAVSYSGLTAAPCIIERFLSDDRVELSNGRFIIIALNSVPYNA